MKLVLLRHGQSKWNLENKFTGWTDVDLTEKGEAEAKNAGKLIKNEKIKIDLVFTSVLKRAINTMNICLSNMDDNNPEIFQDWSLNERHYGSLQGLNKSETAEKYGDDQVHIWRRSYDVNPPGGESLKNVVERVKPYFESTIKKDLKDEKNIILSAHGNSLRALLLILNFYNTKTIAEAEIPTGKPFIVEYENNQLVKKYFL